MKYKLSTTVLFAQLALAVVQPAQANPARTVADGLSAVVNDGAIRPLKYYGKPFKPPVQTVKPAPRPKARPPVSRTVPGGKAGPKRPAPKTRIVTSGPKRIPPIRRDFERVAPPKKPTTPPAKGDPPPVPAPRPRGPIFKPPGF